MALPGLLVTDLDGTLLGSDGSLDPANREALERAGRAGVCRVVATGRSLFSVRRVLPCDAPVDYLVQVCKSQAAKWLAKRLAVPAHRTFAVG